MSEVIFNRRSCREFNSEPVSLENIKLILKAGMYAPSAMNEQAWEFIVVNEKEVLEKLSLTNPYAKALKSCSACIIVATNKDFVKSTLYPEDMAASTENMMLYAAKLNIASCWIGTYPKEDRMSAVKEMFNLPENIEPFSMIALGYPKDPNHFNEAKDRFIEERIHYNRF